MTINTSIIHDIFIVVAFSQKGADLLDNVVVQAASVGGTGVDGQEYVYVDFTYDLNTEAGFLISRRGVMSITSLGEALQSMAAVSDDAPLHHQGRVTACCCCR